MNVFVSLLLMFFLAVAVYSFMVLYTGVQQKVGARVIAGFRHIDRLLILKKAIFRVYVPKKLRIYFFIFWFSNALGLILLAIQISIYK